MATLTEGKRTADFIVSEANGYRSREKGVIDTGVTGTIEPGTVVGIVTATGHYATYNPGNADGTETVAGVLYEGGAADDERTVMVRDCEVRASDLAWFDGATTNQIETGTEALAALGIVAR